MFDFDMGKLLLIGVVALVVIPPKDLPAALRQLGRLVAKARRMAADFQNQFNEAIRDTELDDLKTEFQQLKSQASLTGAVNEIARSIEASASVVEAPTVAPAPEDIMAAHPVQPVESKPVDIEIVEAEPVAPAAADAPPATGTHS